jgi:hypothetical protein
VSPGRPPGAEDAATATTAAPQYPQKLESAGRDCPQEGQREGNDAPQKRQNRIPGGLSLPQERQVSDEASIAQPSYKVGGMADRPIRSYARAGCSSVFSSRSMSFNAPRRRKISSASCCLPISTRMRASA